MRHAKFDSPTIARGQQLVLAFATALPDWTDRMNDVPRLKTIASGDLGVADLTAMEHAALHDQLGPGGAVDGAIDAATAKQRDIRGVDDRVNAQGRDVGDDDFQPRRTNLPRDCAQAEAAALTATPLSTNNCCNSPAWNISRMMSQPPTNSPLT